MTAQGAKPGPQSRLKPRLLRLALGGAALLAALAWGPAVVGGINGWIEQRGELARQRELRSVMVTDLQRVGRAQADHLRRTDQYSTLLPDLGLRLSDGVELTVVSYANAYGWKATVRHRDLNPTFQCGMWDGQLGPHDTYMLNGGLRVPEPRVAECTWDPYGGLT